MAILIDLGLVKKKNYRNKWVYYELTERGEVLIQLVEGVINGKGRNNKNGI